MATKRQLDRAAEELDLQNEFIIHALRLFRVEASQRGKVLDLLQQLQRELAAKLATGDPGSLSIAALRRLLNQTNNTIFQHYREIKMLDKDFLTDLADLEAKFTVKAIAHHYKVFIQPRLPTERYLANVASDTLIRGAPSATWWDKQAEDLSFRFANEVRLGAIQGQTTSEIVKRVVPNWKTGEMGVLTKSTAGARALVQTSLQTVAANTRLETFKANADVIKGVKQVSTLDNRTSPICIAYNDGEWDLEGKPINGTKLPFNGGPPRHWNCRSQLVSIAKTYKELGLDIEEPEGGFRASIDGPLSPGVTFEQFLNRQSQEFQNDLLGRQKAEWWRAGKLKLYQLVDQTGNAMTLDELRRKYKL